MSLLNGFNANDVDDSDFGKGFDPLPEGVYTALIEKTEEKDTSTGTGRMLVCEFSILDEDYRNRKHWIRLNLDNPSASAVNMARAELAQICKAIGVPAPKSHSELENKPLLIEFRVRTKRGEEPRNHAVGYAPVGSAQTGPGKKLKEAVNASAPASKQASTAAAPWKNKTA